MQDHSGLNRQFGSKTAICTLFEGDYHFGLAAFVNSLVHAGFTGTVWAGYRGSLPPWLGKLKQLNSAAKEFMVGDRVRLIFVLLDTPMHFTNYKPQFMLDLFAGPARDCEYLWYFDPDIFIRCSWSYFEDWQQNGIALCQDIVNNILPADSPLRHQWTRAAESIGLKNPRPLNHFFNGGMVGVSAAHVSFLHTWRRFVELAEMLGSDLNVMTENREKAFFTADQDGLNAAAMFSEHPLTTMGPEAMGFVNGGFTMYHAVGKKPWRGSLLLRALGGLPPIGADKFFFTQVSHPIRAYSPSRLRMKRFGCSIASLVGRFYTRR